jgi:Thermolysin metallopeptidase, alpha-helical domain
MIPDAVHLWLTSVAMTACRCEQPGHMKDCVQTTDDDGGVHINSGIPNRRPLAGAPGT